MSPQSPLQSPLRSVSPQSPLQSPLRSVSPQSPLQSPLRSVSPQSPPQSPLHSVSPQSPLQSPLRSGSPQSLLMKPLLSSGGFLLHPGGILLCWPRLGLLLCRPRPGTPVCLFLRALFHSTGLAHPPPRHFSVLVCVECLGSLLLQARAGHQMSLCVEHKFI